MDRTPIARPRRRLPLGLGLAVAAGLAAWAFALEPASLFNEDHEIRLERWPQACDGLEIAVLADLHVGSPWNGLAKLDRIVALTQRARPDLILLAGDYVIHGVVGGEFTTPETIAERLADLSAPMGTWAVLGNHDWWLGAERVRSALEGAGIRMLDDASTRIESDGCAFWLAGVGDLWEGEPDIAGALAAIPPGAPTLAFTHNPDIFPDMPARVSLTIAGHTHGGQVHLPLVGRPIVPSEFGERFAAGHVVEEGRHLFVSTGLGTSILPVRFRVPPEVSLLRLRAPSGGGAGALAEIGDQGQGVVPAQGRPEGPGM